MLMPASSEFIALCQKQVALLTQTLGAGFSVVYLTEELAQESPANLVPIVAYPEPSVLWEERNRLAFLPNRMSRIRMKNLPRLLLASTEDYSMLKDGETINDDGSVDEEGNSLVQQRQIVLPLIHEGVVMGLLVTSREDRGWNQQERVQVERIAHTMAIACILDQRSQWLKQKFTEQKGLQTQQNDILHNLLHQLRNPLTALRTFGKLLLKRLQPGDRNRDVASSILRESDRIQELLQQFDRVIELTTGDEESLVLSPALKVESVNAIDTNPESASGTQPLLLLPDVGLMSDTSLEPCAVAEILEPLLVSAKAIAQERNLKLKIIDIGSNLRPVMANSKALREVFTNLIDNALKYTPAGGKVYIQAGLERQSSEGCYQGIAISDNGPGIPSEDLPRLFDRHYRGVQAKTDIPGTGLGLAIARELVQQMHGEIEVFSPALYPIDNRKTSLKSEIQGTSRVGATFVVWLPEADFSSGN